MLTSTFIHIPGIGTASERRFWSEGAATWQDFLDKRSLLPLTPSKKDHVSRYVEESLNALDCLDHRYFANSLALRDHWRAFPEFSESVAYLDIETTGMGDDALVTMVGIYDGTTYRAYINGIDLQQFPNDIDQYSTLVTYFGGGFDLPVLQHYFPYLRFHQLHIDLCPLLRRLGYKGGLKRIEQSLGIARSDETSGMNGFDAVRLWWEYQRGHDAALELLTHYNREDVINLEPLMHFAYQASLQQLQLPETFSRR